MALGVGPVSAQNPSWFININPTPATVGAGHDAGFIVTVGNNGPSNINDLRVIVTPTDLVPLDSAADDPTYRSTPLAYAINGTPVDGPQNCIGTRPLTCLLGTLVAGESVTFTVAYAVPSDLRGNFDINVAIRAGTGDPGGKNNSRGDAFDKSDFATIASGDSDAGFVVGADVYQTNPTLGTKNLQSTKLEGTPELIPVTIEDGIQSLAACDSISDDPDCTGLFGEWSRLNVNNGNGGVNFATPFKVTLVIRGSAVPGGVQAGDIHVVHVLDNGSINVLTQNCVSDGTPPDPNAECIVVTKVGSNWKIEVWLLQNGSARGGI
jgi:hypothetical protein